ncbi:MAG TPA: thioredoxin domain-containing protein [Gemmatimonadales bacterium]|nr:thioredoxin domain-containing protein [Gemmatimonadales bacterium]
MAILVPPVEPRDHAQGSVSAPLTLVEYGDYECPHCGAAHPVVKRLQEKLGSRLRFVFRNFPLTTIHDHAEQAAEAAEAAGAQDRFWEMHDQLLGHQDDLEDDRLLAHARALSLDMKKFEADLKSHAFMSRVKEDLRSGIRSGVNGTPNFFINGRRHDRGPTYEELLAALEAAVPAK